MLGRAKPLLFCSIPNQCRNRCPHTSAWGNVIRRAYHLKLNNLKTIERSDFISFQFRRISCANEIWCLGTVMNGNELKIWRIVLNRFFEFRSYLRKWFLSYVYTFTPLLMMSIVERHFVFFTLNVPCQESNKIATSPRYSNSCLFVEDLWDDCSTTQPKNDCRLHFKAATYCSDKWVYVWLSKCKECKQASMVMKWKKFIGQPCDKVNTIVSNVIQFTGLSWNIWWNKYKLGKLI